MDFKNPYSPIHFFSSNQIIGNMNEMVIHSKWMDLWMMNSVMKMCKINEKW